MRNNRVLRDIVFILSCVALFLFIFRSLLFNLSTNLLDWFDYPYYVWIINHNVDAFKSLKIDGFFDSNIFYPNKGTFLFSDILLLPSILALVLSYFTSNVLISFNLLFFVTFLLNCLAAFFFWNRIFSNKTFVYFATALTSFSPYVFLSINHFQLFSFWPMLLGMSFLFDNHISFKKIFLIGVISGLQFATGVYLSIFMLFAIFIWFVLKIFYERLSRKMVSLRILQILIFSCAFLLTAGLFITKYIQVKNAYYITRDYGEYVLYSAHLSDYIFTSHYGSLLSTSKLGEKWNSYNKHLVGESAGFPGFVILTLAAIGIFGFRKSKNEIIFAFDLNFTRVYFVILTITAFIFSLGPRLNVNGAYTAIPLPYHLIMKLVPILEPIRAPSRWMVLFYLGLIYFSIIGLKKILQHFPSKSWIIIAAGALFFIELIPINKTTEAKDYYPGVYQVISKQCQSTPLVLLEYPLTQFFKEANLYTNLTYRTQIMLASVNHKCYLINGYHGYIPETFNDYESRLFNAVEKHDSFLFWNLLTDRKVDLIKLNKDDLYDDRVLLISGWLKKSKDVTLLYEDQHYLVVQLNTK